MWPWEAFNWGVFWAIMAAATICFIIGVGIHLIGAFITEG
jgi:hypothetical protein